ncbi:MAG: DUF2309 domain-containing protein [Myxococcales bacterium]|nr:DUF2309 domain-containing protein [Myxococcales bacterium]
MSARHAPPPEPTAATVVEPDDHPDPEPRRARLRRALEHAAHLLPAQAPLEVFVHHNTLHAFEHLPFHEALGEAARKLGSRGYLPEERYREAFATGRITEAEVAAALAELAPPCRLAVEGFPSATALARLVLLHGVRAETPASVSWATTERGAADAFAADSSPLAQERIVVETYRWLREHVYGDDGVRNIAHLVCGDADGDPVTRLGAILGIAPKRAALLEALEDRAERVAVRALWTACRELTSPGPAAAAARRAPARLAEQLAAVSHEDPDDLVHPVLIHLAGAFLDRGQSQWSMPDREAGFFDAWRRVLTSGHAVRAAWLARLGARLRDGLRRGVDAEGAVLELLDEIGVADDDLDAFVEHTLLRLPGWAGMFHRLEHGAGSIGRTSARVRLVDYLAVRLTLDALAWADVGRRLGHRGPLAELGAHCATLPLVAPQSARGDHDTAWPLFRVAQLAGVSAPVLRRAGRAGVAEVVRVLDAFDEPARLRIWHEAYERHYRDEVLHALAVNVPHRRPEPTPRFQIVTCIDDRSESLRRHFEALSESHETLGAAGFFNLAIAYRGIDDPTTFPLCPVVIEPRHRIEEEPASEHRLLALRRQRRLRRWGRVNAAFARASRSLLWGPLVTATSGLLAALPLLASVFAPWVAGRLRRSLARRLLPSPRTRLTAGRPSGDVRPSADERSDELFDGFELDEKAARVGDLLESLGLTTRFAPLVAIVGHDSSSVNNPHFAAYSCGACGGRSGGPNARLFARMANRSEVRERLRERGIDVPDATVFVGAVQDTATDTVTFFDVEALPAERLPALDALRDALAEACRRNAHERCRKFESAPRDATPAQALRHVEGRAFDLSQARPELGHATNASCVVGRRMISRGLFLDRRAFLVSYDPTGDADGSILERVLLAVAPVGAGINLEYFFSTVDNQRLGAGTKLPHNVTGLFGVVDGASSDLRTGLPTQMIEIHEPLRLQLVVETEPELLTAIVARQPSLARLVDNEWVRVSVIAPDGSTFATYEPGRGFRPWSPPERALEEVDEAASWYAGKLGYVAPARLVGRSPLRRNRRSVEDGPDVR